MQLAVFGSAGLAGAAVSRLALENGHEVRALVRGPNAVPGVEVIRGDALDPSAVERTLRGADAVISTLGGFRGPESIAAGTRNIITAMRETGGSRLVVLQGFHIDFPGDPWSLGRRFVETYLRLRCRLLVPYGAELGELLRATDEVAWTLVRIPRMVEGAPSGRARAGRFSLGPWSVVRTGDVAAHLLSLAQNESSVHDAPMLHTPRSRHAAPTPAQPVNR
ncbi:NAD(P)H-binding protein [Kribbella sp. NBC_01245]|uniref:NAD(P)-dependent oxidoreductase n=1 Tax=Kribbella sp. NBC_01245 TaxID=2903578 RepID=UPI002E2B3114|nr:NAD(P)H-binding protein [Kribbella sp. NBC_01245]